MENTILFDSRNIDNGIFSYDKFLQTLSNIEDTNDNIICYANLGLWDGNKQAYKEFSTSIKETITSLLTKNIIDFVCFCDDDLRVYQYHHDGVNKIIIRQWKTSTNNSMRNKVINAIYCNKPDALEQYLQYTTPVKDLLLCDTPKNILYV